MENAQFARVKCRMMPVPASGGAAAAAAAAAGDSGPLRATLVCLMNNRAGSYVALWELDEDGLLSMRNSCKVRRGLDARGCGGHMVVDTHGGVTMGPACLGVGCEAPWCRGRWSMAHTEPSKRVRR